MPTSSTAKPPQIDALIAKKQRQIELLQEHRTALINQAVTKGLNPDVPMKDSGIEWLGEVPAHWEIMQLKFAAPRVTIQVKNHNSSDFKVALENIDSHTGSLVGGSTFDGIGNAFQKGDVLYNKLRPY